MKRMAVLSLPVLSVLALAACASEPEPAAMTAPPEPPPPAAAPQPVVETAPPMQETKAPEAMPAMAPEAATMPAPAPAAEPAPAAATAPAQADPHVLVYLASYKTEKSALAGYARLSKASPILASGKPVTRSFDLGRKGTWVRLYALAADEGERSTICRQVGKQVDECGARNRE